MSTPQTGRTEEGPPNVILIEGERDFKPRPEALVNWPKFKPPGGRLTETYREPQAKSRAGTENKYRRRFFIKVVGLGDLIEELDEDPLSQPVLQWLAEQLNNDETRLMINSPGVGSRGPKEAPLDVQMCAGYAARGSAHFDPQGPDGPGVYTEVEVVPPWIELIGAMIDSPGGVDLTAFYKNSIVSLDVVVRSRGTGKFIAEVEPKTSQPPCRR